MRALWMCACAASMVGAAQSVLAQTASGAPAVVSLRFEGRAGVPHPLWSMEIGADGHGRYLDGAGDAPAREIRVSLTERELLMSGEAAVKAGGCETKRSNIASAGKKTLSYMQGEAHARCTFGFSDDQRLNEISSAFQAIANTIQIGDELARLRRFDRLGLDAEVDALQSQIDSGFAIEVENIAPVLRGIADDDRVMERVRRKVTRILDAAAKQTGSVPPDIQQSSHPDIQ